MLTVLAHGTEILPHVITKRCVTAMITVLANGMKIVPHVILGHKTMPMEKLPMGLMTRCQTMGWMTNKLMRDWLQVVWNRRPGVLFKK
jgi:hypothetical protein